MSEHHRPPSPSVIEVLLFAPLGAVLSVWENLPRWAEQGRARTETRVRVARMVGEFAVRTGVKEVERRIAGRGPRRDTAGTAAETGSSGSESAADGPARSGSAHTGSAQGDAAVPVHKDLVPKETAAGAGSMSAPSVDSLPIPAYDSLAASQVVERLNGLNADELAAVRAYEAAGRHRQTVLHRIDQLSGS